MTKPARWRPWVLASTGAGVVALVAVILFASTYKSEFIDLPASAEPSSVCPIVPPNHPIPVDEIAQKKWRMCDPVGHRLVFPDGATVEITKFGGSTGLDQGPGKPRYYVENLGKWGVIGVRVEGGAKQYWGANKGVRAVKNRRSGT